MMLDDGVRPAYGVEAVMVHPHRLLNWTIAFQPKKTAV